MIHLLRMLLHVEGDRYGSGPAGPVTNGLPVRGRYGRPRWQAATPCCKIIVHVCPVKDLIASAFSTCSAQPLREQVPLTKPHLRCHPCGSRWHEARYLVDSR